MSIDDALTAVVGTDTRHRVAGLPEEPPEAGLALAFGGLRAAGVTALRLALPAPGDPVGLAGPPAFNEAAVAATEGVVCQGAAWGLVPEVMTLGSSGTEVRWRVHEANAPVVAPTLAEADRELASAVREATELLTQLDVARWDRDIVAALTRLRDHEAELLPPTLPPRARRVLGQGRWVSALTRLALAHDGAAVSAPEMRARAAALAPLDRAGRRAVMAAANFPLER